MATDAERNRGLGAYSTPGVDQKPDTAPTKIITSAPETHWVFQGLSPASNIYITPDDGLQVQLQNSFAGASFDLKYRCLTVDNVIHRGQFTFIPPSDRTDNSFLVTMPEGFLLSLSIGQNPINIKRGQAFAQVRFRKGTIASGNGMPTLLAGYMSGRTEPTWPVSPPQYSADGPGFIRSIVGTTPAAGADISETVPSGARWKLRSIQAALTTSATVANRRPALLFDDGVNTFFQVTWNFQQAASLAVGYNAALAATLVPDIANTNFMTSLGDCILSAGFRIRTATPGLQVGDQWTAPRYEVEEWLEL